MATESRKVRDPIWLRASTRYWLESIITRRTLPTWRSVEIGCSAGANRLVRPTEWEIHGDVCWLETAGQPAGTQPQSRKTPISTRSQIIAYNDCPPSASGRMIRRLLCAKTYKRLLTPQHSNISSKLRPPASNAASRVIIFFVLKAEQAHWNSA